MRKVAPRRIPLILHGTWLRELPITWRVRWASSLLRSRTAEIIKFALPTEQDLDTRVVPLSGCLRHGLYALDVPPVSQVFSGVSVLSTHWHARLGHPATPIVRHVLHRHELPIVHNNNADLVCDVCQQGKSHPLPFS